MANTDLELAEHYNETRDLSGFESEPEPVTVRRNVTISVRFSDDEIRQLRAAADEASEKLTAYIRRVALTEAVPAGELWALVDQADDAITSLRRLLTNRR